MLPAWFCLGPVYGDTQEVRFQDYLKHLHSMQAEFHQTVSRDHSVTDEKSRGVLMILRPGRFRWEYQSPYHQLIIADGSKIWIYDSDLEQVTVKSQHETLGEMPAMLLLGESSREERFATKRLGVKEGLEWLEVVAGGEESSFARMLLGFDGEIPQAMELADRFGQTTRLRFTHVRMNLKLDPKLFEFVPPAGADVVGDTGE